MTIDTLNSTSFKKHSISQKLMGCRFELGIVSDNKTFADHQLQIGVQAIIRLENLLSEFLTKSDLHKINTTAWKKPVKIKKETFDLIERSLNISALTKGHFDISTAALKSIYQFKNKNFTFPNQSTIQAALKKVDYTKIKLDKNNNSIFLKNKNMQLSFAAIGKGYAADVVKKIWLENGVKNGFINSSGDMAVLGKNANSENWNIAIANPDNKNEPLLTIALKNNAIATSGDYEQYFMHDNIRYSHNISPINGLPITGIKSVSVISPSAELSDALATAIYAMGIKKGIHFIDQLPQTHCIFISSNNKIYFSKNINSKRNMVSFSNSTC